MSKKEQLLGVAFFVATWAIVFGLLYLQGGAK